MERLRSRGLEKSAYITAVNALVNGLVNVGVSEAGHAVNKPRRHRRSASDSGGAGAAAETAVTGASTAL
jgi:hypothetical protein